MTIRDEIREVEKHAKAMAETRDEQLKIISRVQGILAIAKDERNLSILAIVKNRIIRNKESK